MRRAVVLLLCAAAAGAGGPVRTERAEVELVAAHRRARPGSTVRVGLRFALDPGWHVYWRNPGDSGEPPRITWTLPAGVEAGPIRWPAPERIPVEPFMTFGYEGDLLLPVDLRVPAGLAGPLRIRAEAIFLICERFCLPGEATLELELPVGADEPAPDPRWEALFAASERLLPAAPPAGWSAFPRGARLVLRATGLGAAEPVVFFPDRDGIVKNPAPQPLTRSGDTVEIALEPAGDGAPPRLAGVLAAGHGTARRAYSVDLPVADAAESGGMGLALVAGRARR